MGPIGEQLGDVGVGPSGVIGKQSRSTLFNRLVSSNLHSFFSNVKGCSPKAYNSLINLGSVQLNYFIRYLITTPLSFL
ncbi:unnamed protein product [Schistosoma guineensis]|nr:unnamed protein product [Schistosoma guineensis]